MDLGFIGTGTITAAVVAGIADAGHRITVSERSTVQSARLAAQFACVTAATNQDVVDRSAVVLLGLQSTQAPQVLAGLRFRAGQQVISFIAELPLERIAALVAPAEAVAIMLPFPAIARGPSPILTLGDTTLIRALFCPTHTVFALQSAAELRACLCAQAVLSPVLAMLVTAADWMADQGIDPAMGEPFLRALVGSSLQADDCTTSLAALSTPGGFNLRLRQTLQRAGLQTALSEGLDALNH
ncbi:MAG: NAD(P)-binding domain-containing protein [Paracoccaceae bacterium]|nr:NAD(P)-binding domain-containing protein [Paracoccaceae bacterium]